MKSVAEKPTVAPSSEVRRWSSVAALVPGVALCALGATVALIAGQFTSAVSPLLIAIVAGAVLANTVSLAGEIPTWPGILGETATSGGYRSARAAIDVLRHRPVWAGE